MLIDAEPLVRSVITRILEADGYHVHSCGDLRGAVELLEACAPDLLITNVWVPGIGGYEAARLLRMLCPKLRVLMVAGLPDDGELTATLSSGEHNFFPKPFTSQELLNKVREVLRAPAS